MFAVVVAVVGLAQSLQVYSEFRRIGPSGEIVAADQGRRPREMLSPAVARNAFLSMHVFVNVPAGKPYELHVAQNPDGTVSAGIYREIHLDGVPDRLDKCEFPIQSKGPAAYWLDVWVPAGARPGRLRLEAQLYVDDRWIIYPMELRVREATVPAHEPVPARVPPIEARADASVLGPWRAAVCGEPEPGAEVAGPTVRSLIRRNALQDVAQAGRDVARYRDRFCGQAAATADPEWYLGIRDRLREPVVRPSDRY